MSVSTAGRVSRCRYRLLAEILLGQLAAGPEPAAAARHAGRAWGAHLVTRPAPGYSPGGSTAGESTDRLLAMLDELDFAPEPVTDRPDAGREMAGERDVPDRIRSGTARFSSWPSRTASWCARCTSG